MGHGKTMQAQIRRRKTRRLIRVSNVCLQNVLKNVHNPKIGNGLFQLIGIGKYSWL